MRVGQAKATDNSVDPKPKGGIKHRTFAPRCVQKHKLFFEHALPESVTPTEQGPVARKLDSAIHRIVIFSSVVKMLQRL